MYRSEIRDSDIEELTQRVQNRKNTKYLYKINLVNIRGFKNQIISFDFPVTALIGPNGGGKTTILGAAGCAYKSIKPRYFFPRSGNLDESMVNWKIVYELADKETLKGPTIVKRTANYPQSKWKRDHFLDREVVSLGVSRTVPLHERKEYRKFVSNQLSIDPAKIEELDPHVIDQCERILGKNLKKFSRVNLNIDGTVSLLCGKTEDSGSQYSEFHFGAGESSILRMVFRIESLEDNALVLIEEIENGLHPIATRRMVEYLIDVAKRKRIQIIFTTHSNEALKPLPDIAIWASVNKELIQGKLNIYSLREITGEIPVSLIIFVEDEFAGLFVKTILRSISNISLEAIQIFPRGGDGSAVKIHKANNHSGSISPIKSICILDGDSNHLESIDDLIFKLPGSESPEIFLINKVLSIWDECGDDLRIALHCSLEKSEIYKIISNVRLPNRDHHLLFDQMGDALGGISPEIVQNGFIYSWTQQFPEEVATFCQPFIGLLPKLR